MASSTRNHQSQAKIIGYRNKDGSYKYVDEDDPLPVKDGQWHKVLKGYDPEMITNGAFAADTNWTKGSGWTIAAGVASHAATNKGTTLTQDPNNEKGVVPVLANNTTYLITFTISAYTSGGVAPSIGGTAGTSRTAAGTYTEEITTPEHGTTLNVVFTADADDDFVGSIDDVSVRQKVTDGVFTFTPLSTTEDTIFIDQRDTNGFLEVYFRALTSAGTNGLAAMTFNGRHAYMWDDDGEVTYPKDTGATNEIEYASGVDMTTADTVSGSFSNDEEYAINGSKSKYGHSAFYVLACTDVGAAADDTGTILAYVSGR